VKFSSLRFRKRQFDWDPTVEKKLKIYVCVDFQNFKIDIISIFFETSSKNLESF